MRSFGRVVRAEWTKLRTVPSTGWLVLAVVAATLGIGAIAITGAHTNRCPLSGCPVDLVRFSLVGVWASQAAVALLAVVAVTNEYGTGLIHVTVASCPRRPLIVAAKATTIAGLVVVAGAIGSFGSLVVARAVLPGNGFTAAKGYTLPSFVDEPTLRAAAGTALYLGLIALFGAGVGLLVRDTAWSITIVLGLLYLSPILITFLTSPRWRERAQEWAPTAGLSIQATKRLDLLPIGPWAGLGVLGCYAAVALVAGLLALQHRDA